MRATVNVFLATVVVSLMSLASLVAAVFVLPTCGLQVEVLIYAGVYPVLLLDTLE
jgi:hypothetical protein